jgi:hypothetical protein
MNQEIVKFRFQSVTDPLDQYEPLSDEIRRVYDEGVRDYLEQTEDNLLDLRRRVRRYPVIAFYMTPAVHEHQLATDRSDGFVDAARGHVPEVRDLVAALLHNLDLHYEMLNDAETPDERDRVNDIIHEARERIQEMEEVALLCLLGVNQRAFIDAPLYQATYLGVIQEYAQHFKQSAQVGLVQELDYHQRQQMVQAPLDHLHYTVGLNRYLNGLVDTLTPSLRVIERSYLFLQNGLEMVQERMRDWEGFDVYAPGRIRVYRDLVVIEHYIRVLAYNHFMIVAYIKLAESFVNRKIHSSTLLVPVPEFRLLHENSFHLLNINDLGLLLNPHPLNRLTRLALISALVAVFYQYPEQREYVQEYIELSRCPSTALQVIRALERRIEVCYNTIRQRLGHPNTALRVIGFI